MKYCVYNENLIVFNDARHYRQFRETRDGDRLPIFPDNRAIIEIDLADRYKVSTTNGEVLFIGTGFDKAVSRIYYAQPDADIEVVANDRKFTLDEYYRHIAPVIWLIAQYYDEETNRLAVAYERRKNDEKLDAGTVIFTDDTEFADWLFTKLQGEERPPVVKFGDWVPAIVRDKLTAIELNDDYTVEFNRGTWQNLRRKAKKAVLSDEST